MTTPTPFKLVALRAVTDALKEITPTNGYTSDMGDFELEDTTMQSRVFRGRAWYGSGDPVPMLSLLEAVDPASLVGDPPVDTATGEYDWPLLLQGFLQDDPVNPTDPAYFLLADVRWRLSKEIVRKVPGGHQPDPFGLGRGKNRITKVIIGSGVVRPADDISAKTYFWLPLTLRIVDNPAAPFS